MRGTGQMTYWLADSHARLAHGAAVGLLILAMLFIAATGMATLASAGRPTVIPGQAQPGHMPAPLPGPMAMGPRSAEAPGA